MKKLLTFGVGILLLLSSTLLKSQDTCGLATVMQSLLQAYPSYQDSLNSFEFNYRQDAITRGGINITDDRIIPVVFHVFHNNGSENISDMQVIQAVDQMNTHFAGMEGGINTKIRFKLATIDPSGNCTNGIVRIQRSNPDIPADDYSAQLAFKNQSGVTSKNCVKRKKWYKLANQKP